MSITHNGSLLIRYGLWQKRSGYDWLTRSLLISAVSNKRGSPLPAISLVYNITSESYHLQADEIWSRKPPVPTKFDIISIYKTFWVHTYTKEIFHIIKFFTIENKCVLNWKIFRNCIGKESLAILHIALHIAWQLIYHIYRILLVYWRMWKNKTLLDYVCLNSQGLSLFLAGGQLHRLIW